MYITGKFGVRLENLLLCIKAQPLDGYDMCRFEPLSLVPFDNDAIDVSMLSVEELQILSDYTKMILDKVGPHLDDTDLEWLKNNI